MVDTVWAADVIGPAYDALRPFERRRLADGNADSFFNVIRAPLDYGADPVPADLVERNRTALDRLLATGRYRPPGAPTLFAYRLRSVDHSQVAVIGDVPVAAVARGEVLAHERTRVAKETEIATQLGALAINASPVGLTYRSDSAIDTLVAELCALPPELDFHSDDGLHHTVWRASEPMASALSAAFAGVDRLYIVDGHHRVAAARRLDHGSFLAGLVPDDQLRLLAYHRIVVGPCAVSPAAVAATGAERLDTPRPPTRRGEAVLYLAGGGWYRVDLAGAGPDGDADELDVRLAERQLLGPLGGIADPRTDPRLEFVPGGTGIGHLARRADESGGLAVALHPMAVAQLFGEADAGRTMPPKSTWFEPKFRSGIFLVRR